MIHDSTPVEKGDLTICGRCYCTVERGPWEAEHKLYHEQLDEALYRRDLERVVDQIEDRLDNLIEILRKHYTETLTSEDDPTTIEEL